MSKATRVGTFVMCMAFLAFVIGMAVASARVFPYQVFADAYQGLQYVYNYIHVRRIPPAENVFLFGDLEGDDDNVVRFDPDRAQPGLTLLSSGHASAAFLISLDGRVVHKWELPFSKAWPDPPHKNNPIKDDRIFWRKTHVYPNGDLLAIYEAPGASPQSYGMVKVDKDSNLIWDYPEFVHHDFDVAVDGRIYTLINVIRDERIPALEKVRRRHKTIAQRPVPVPILDDSVVELSADGGELRRVSILDAFLNSDYAGILSIAPMRRWDALHANSVAVIDENFANLHPEFEAGQILISLKELSAIAVLDLDSEKIVWAKLGSWREQHDADPLENGNILMFDNFGHPGPGRPSRVLEIDPMTTSEEWTYAGTDTEPLFSWIRSSQQLLPNGNLLVTESNSSRVFEVTRGGDIVWEFINPVVRVASDKKRRAILCEAQRYDPANLTFLQ